MPLTERDVNTQDGLPRIKRNLLQSHVAFSQLKDENSPKLRGTSSKALPPSKRSLVPTEASNSSAGGPSTHRGSNPSPRPQRESKLPRRAPTSSPALVTGQGNGCASERVASEEKMNESSGRSRHRSSSITTRQPRPTHQSAPTGPTKPAMNKRLPAEKALPTRPIASLVNSLSPSKDSRVLIDASEQPLMISVGDNQRHWPALTPRPASAPAIQISKDSEPCNNDNTDQAATLPSRASSMIAAATQLTNVIVGKPSTSTEDSGNVADAERSSTSSFFSANDTSPKRLSRKVSFNEPERTMSMAHAEMQTENLYAAGDGSHCLETKDSTTNHNVRPGFPARATSLRKCTGSGITDFTRNHRIDTLDSRPHSPSLASFSQPRPSTLSHTRLTTSPSPSGSTTTSAVAVRMQKTASRIPILDTKKATLVDIKSRTSLGIPGRSLADSPSFGIRTLDAPDALKILDEGIKRRQLLRADTNASSTSDRSYSTLILNSQETLVAEQRKPDSFADTNGPSSSDEDEVTTPFEHLPGLCTNYYYDKAAMKLFDGTVMALGKRPPPTSPFTEPLQTIPSQAVLPSYNEDVSNSSMHNQAQSSPLQTVANQISQIETAVQGRAEEHKSIPNSARNFLIDLLTQYEREDSRRSRDDSNAMGDETRTHLTRTLLLLEGKGSPPKTEVDNEALLHIFGHMKRELEKPTKTVSFLNNVAIAEKFLAQADKATASIAISEELEREASQSNSRGTDEGSDAKDNCASQMEAIASKWSNSTSSDKATSAELGSILPHPALVAAPKAIQKIQAQKQSSTTLPRSTGYPCRVPGNAPVMANPAHLGSAEVTNGSRRESSPTLGKRYPGSVRAARETLREVQGSFQRTTTSADSKKTAKFSTPNKRPSNPSAGMHHRRDTLTEKLHPDRDTVATSQTPRSKSKSRSMLNKINGLFSGKRVKKSSSAPSPLPQIKKNDVREPCHVKIAPSGGRVLQTAGHSPLTKMPNMSHLNLNYPALRNTPHSTNRTDGFTAVDGKTSPDDKYCLQMWSEDLIERAKRETHIARKERLLNFAKVLNDSLISAREAQISAETAAQAARTAHFHYEKTQKSIAMLQRLAISLGHTAQR